jgi:NTE family protein
MVSCRLLIVCSAFAIGFAGCAAPLQRSPAAAAASLQSQERSAPDLRAAEGRPVIGVAFGGGSARGIAHIGVIRWFEEHRIPIDVAAGTSMGGLVGGAFAAGMDADELDVLISTMNWDQLFGASSFAFKNIRRKADTREFPSRLEFGMRHGIVPPTALNNGEQVERFLGRIGAPYYDLRSFDELPTPFRTVAVDVVSASEVVLDHGSLATAMRATMSLPLIFPPVEVDGKVLVDGGVMNNVPADVVRGMGAARVVAINVGELEDKEALSYTLLSVAGNTIDAMTRASTRRALEAADVVINVPLEAYGSLDWRRSAELIREGYKAAEAMRAELLPLAVSEQEYARWKQERQGRRRRELPAISFVEVTGFSAGDADRLRALLPRYVGSSVDVDRLERDLAPLSGLDRYQTVTWRLTKNAAGESGLAVVGQPKPYAPPFLMLGVNLENTRTNDFRITMTGRYLNYGQLGSNSELRVDATLGSDPGLGAELYEPLWRTPFFAAPYAGITTSTINVIADDAVYARYGQTFARVGGNVGVNLGARSDLSVGAYVGRRGTSLQVGDPALPDVKGAETGLESRWRFDNQDSPVVPSGGTQTDVRLRHLFNSADLVIADEPIRSESSITQLSGGATHFWSRGRRNRLFVYGAAGTSFDGEPLQVNQFTLGTPLRLGAYRQGEVIGNHYWVATTGYLRQIGRLPDFMGGPVYAGGWLENGDAFKDSADATWRTNASAAVVADTLVGPALLAGSFGAGEWRIYIGVGRIFR